MIPARGWDVPSTAAVNSSGILREEKYASATCRVVATLCSSLLPAPPKASLK